MNTLLPVKKELVVRYSGINFKKVRLLLNRVNFLVSYFKIYLNLGNNNDLTKKNRNTAK